MRITSRPWLTQPVPFLYRLAKVLDLEQNITLLKQYAKILLNINGSWIGAKLTMQKAKTIQSYRNLISMVIRYTLDDL